MKISLRYSYLYVKEYPRDTGRKLNIHKTFRRRSGRLLNVLLRLISLLCPVRNELVRQKFGPKFFRFSWIKGNELSSCITV